MSTRSELTGRYARYLRYRRRRCQRRYARVTGVERLWLALVPNDRTVLPRVVKFYAEKRARAFAAAYNEMWDGDPVTVWEVRL